jgi:hypothetical protein
MSPWRPSPNLLTPRTDTEITDAALRAYRRLRAAVGGLRAHRAGDGGLICEHRLSRARPILWRISPSGTVLPDSRYSFALRTFTTAALPHGA